MTEHHISSICAELLTTVDADESFSEALALYLYEFFVYGNGLGSEEAETATAGIFEKYESVIEDYENRFYESIA